MKIVLTLKTYLVPNVDNPIVRIPMWQETQTFETLFIGYLTIEKTLTVYDQNTYSYGNSVHKSLKCLGCVCFAKCVM